MIVKIKKQPVINVKIVFAGSKPKPVVISLSNQFGTTTGNQVLTITGLNFTGITKVKFGDAFSPSISVINDKNISVKTPANSSGIKQLSVTTSGGSTSKNFTYVQVPELISISPNFGRKNNPAQVTFTGIGFNEELESIKFGNSFANLDLLQIINSTTLKIKPPNFAGGPSQITVPVSITTRGGTATINNGYTYYAPVNNLVCFGANFVNTGTLGDKFLNTEVSVKGGDLITVIGSNVQNITSLEFIAINKGIGEFTYPVYSFTYFPESNEVKLTTPDFSGTNASYPLVIGDTVFLRAFSLLQPNGVTTEMSSLLTMI